jgi:hypothetical protein
MRNCAYEGRDFDDSEFDDTGVHLGILPRHLFTGELVTTEPGGWGPFDRPADPFDH